MSKAFWKLLWVRIKVASIRVGAQCGRYFNHPERSVEALSGDEESFC